MNAPLNVLFIEDNRADFILVERHLKKHRMEVHCERAATPSELETLLASRAWDAILSDYNVPGMNFEKNLGHIRARFPDVPVILVSGALGEEKAVALLKLGVTDFLLKDNLARLIPALERALLEVAELRAKRAAEEALRDAEAQLRAHGNRLEELVAERTSELERANRRLAEDIQERKRIEEALSQEKQRAVEAMREAETHRRNLDALIEAVPVGIAMADARGRVLRINRENKRLWGESSDNPDHYEGRKMWWNDGTERQGRPLQRNEWVLARALKGEEAPRNLVEIEPFDTHGDRRSVLVSGAPVRDAEGKIIGAVAAQVDITERMKTERALRESEALFRTMTNVIPQIVWSARGDGYHDYFNDRWYEFTGAQRGSTDGEEWLRLFHPDDWERATKEWQRCLATGAPYEIEYRIRHRSGEYRWTLGRALPVRDEKGNIFRWMGTCTDIHEQKTIHETQRRSEEKFRLLYENAPIGIAHIDLQGRWVYANRKFAEITRYAPEDVVGLGYLDITPLEEQPVSVELTQRLLAGEIDVNREQRILRKDGTMSWVRLTARMLRNESGQPQYGIAIFEDIDERKRAEAALRESEERFRTTFENAPLGIGKTRPDGVFTRANPKLLETLGYSLEELRRLSIVDITHPADKERAASDFQKQVSDETGSYVSEKRFIRKDGSFVWMSITTAVMRIEGVADYVIGIFEDVTARKRAEEDLRRALEHSYHLANHDALTGLANRARFNDRLEEALSYARRDNHLVAVHLLDLDRFKAINDTLGHHMGDLLLKEVAHRIHAQTRSTDVVARLGGDEFVVIQTHLAAPSAAAVLAGKIVKELGRPFLLEGQEVRSGSSIGIALFPDDARDPEQLLKRADLALYEAKGSGRYNFQFYRHEMGVALEESQQLEQELRRALREEQFRLHYQPQFDLQTGRISGIEVLLRWQHPEKGLLAATEFIRHAESAGLTPAIGEWVLLTACRQHVRWRDVGLSVPLVLNVSFRQLRHPGFLQTLRRALKETELPPAMMQLEMCESVLWDPKFPASVLKEMKDIGVRLALDDFGTELAALSLLQRFPLDMVKPGRALVNALPRREEEAAIMSAVISVAHKMKIAICAEGVETLDQLEAVREHGCDAAQGYLLGLPINESAMTYLIETELEHY